MIQILRSVIWQFHKAVRSSAGISALGATFLAGCAGFGPVALVPGEPESAVIAKLGKPSRIFWQPDGTGRKLEYMMGPFGQTTHMAEIDGNGILLSYEQVLTTRGFSRIQVGVARKDDVLRLIGTPSETSFLDLPQLEVWSYPYKENPVADSIMHVHFDRAGVVRKMLNGPDLRRERSGGGFGFSRGLRDR